MCLLTPFASSIYPPAPGMVEKNMSSYCRLSHPFFSSSTAPNHLVCSLSASCFSHIDSTSIKLHHESFSFNIFWQFKSLAPEFQLYREKNAISYLSHIDFQTLLICENFIWGKFCQLKGVSSCVMLRFSCMFNQSPVYVWNSRSCTRLLDACIPANVSFCVSPDGFSLHTSVFELHQLFEMNASPGENSTAITSPGWILTLLSLLFHLFLWCFYRLNGISGPAAGSGSISLKKKHAYFSTCAHLAVNNLQHVSDMFYLLSLRWVTTQSSVFYHI